MLRLHTELVCHIFTLPAQVAAAETIAVFGGPRVSITLGRSDTDQADIYTTLLEMPTLTGAQLQYTFEQDIGFSQTSDWVALLGAQVTPLPEKAPAVALEPQISVAVHMTSAAAAVLA